MIDSVILLALGLAAFVLLLVAYKLLKVLFRTVFFGVLGVLSFGVLVYLGHVDFSYITAIASGLVASSLYLLYQLIKVPRWFWNKLSKD